MPDAVIREKVEDYLKKSNALGSVWHRPLTGSQLQAEMVRIAASTRDPQVLSDLMQALGNDPQLIAERLARPILADRLIHGWYADDATIHAAVRVRAERAAIDSQTASSLKDIDGAYSEVTWRREASAAAGAANETEGRVLDADSWNELLSLLFRRLGVEDGPGGTERLAERLPIGRVSELFEDPEGFHLLTVLDRGADFVRVAAVDFAKVPFDSWWGSRATTESRRLEAATMPFSPVTAKGAGCVQDSWTPTRQDVPDAGAGHVAVWTGTEMIVWGGRARSGDTAMGGRYTPASDSWSVTGSTGAPTARRNHTAVFLGTEMIVWGGSDLTPTGGRYRACPNAATFYRDADGDGFGRADDTITACDGVRPAGYATVSGDCDDGHASVYPVAPQLCDGLNNDCCSPSWPVAPANEADADLDGIRICQGDCNDADASVYPGATQLCDGKNNNCSDPSWPAVPANEANADGDAFRVCTGDCNDGDATVYPGAPQLCDGKNNNCSDPTSPTIPANEADADGDGFRICQNDCNDANPNIRPNAIDVCNGIDDNWNGLVGDDAQGVDSDGDGVHNACDNCRFVSNATQTDTDGDTLGDACDNRLFDFNPSQSDLDHDGEGDVCDVNDGLIYVFGTDDKNYIEWQGGRADEFERLHGRSGDPESHGRVHPGAGIEPTGEPGLRSDRRLCTGPLASRSGEREVQPRHRRDQRSRGIPRHEQRGNPETERESLPLTAGLRKRRRRSITRSLRGNLPNDRPRDFRSSSLAEGLAGTPGDPTTPARVVECLPRYAESERSGSMRVSGYKGAT